MWRFLAVSCWGEWRFLAVSCWVCGDSWLFLVGVNGDSWLFLVGVHGDSWLFLVGVREDSCFLLWCMKIPGCFLLGCMEIPVSCWGAWRFLFLVGIHEDSWLFLVGERGVSPGSVSLPRPEAEVLPVSFTQHFSPGSAGITGWEPCLSHVTASDIFSLQTGSVEPSPTVSSGQQHPHRVQFSRETFLEGTEADKTQPTRRPHWPSSV